MNYGLQVLLKEPFHYLKGVNGRKFIKLCSRFGNINRYECRTFKFNGRQFTFVDSWSFLWQYHDIFFRRSYEFKAKSASPTIIDCGGNVGTSILFFKTIYPLSSIVCFEADPNVFQVLKKNVNHLEGVTLFQKAVWNHNDGIRMQLDNADGAHASSEGQEIASVRLKDILQSYEAVDLLKIDIEGAEFEVLEDVKNDLAHVERLFIEVHTFANEPQEVSNILEIVENAGFRYYLEQAGEQKVPLSKEWKISPTGMDTQINLFCVR